MNRINRRAWLAQSTAGVVSSLLGRAATTEAFQKVGSDLKNRPLNPFEREYIRSRLYSRADIDAWLAGKGYPFSKYDPELGYLHIDRQFKEGLDGAICTYHYDAHGARHAGAYADRPCRINTYGNSFTSCEQVSDQETWQEVLAGHLGEPIRNFGIGGYSVYQAYLRMKREQARLPTPYVIFNIFDDDHYRNLNGWQRPRFGVNRKSTNPPVPHVKADPDSETFVERPNPCPTKESLYTLCDLETACALLADDYSVRHFAHRKQLRAQGAKNVPQSDFDDSECTRRALYATTRIVDLIEAYAGKQRVHVLYVLSYAADRIRRFVVEGKRFDASLVEFLNRRGLPVVDLLAAHAADAGKFRGSLDACLSRYFIGHYNPLGNFFCAFAMKDKVVHMLSPPPPAYRH